MTQRSRFKLRFDEPSLEEAFIAHYDAEHRFNIAGCLVLGLVMHTLFMGLDYVAHPAHSYDFMLIRLFLALPPLLVTIALCLHPRWYRWAQHAGAVAITTSGLSIVWMIGVLSTSAQPTVAYSSGLLLVLFFAYSFLRLRLGFALAGSLAFTVAYEFTLLSEWDWLAPHVLEQQYFILGGHIIGVATCWTLESATRKNYLAEQEIIAAHKATMVEREKSDQLLDDVFPSSVATRLKNGESFIANGHQAVSVLFIDLVGFTDLAEAKPPEEVVALLDQHFGRLDDLADKYNASKIKTIGDAYMVIAGAPETREDHATALADLALDLVSSLSDIEAPMTSVRVGLHCGPVVAGVIGRKRPAYDLWGSTVNLSSRLECHGLPGKVHISSEMKAALGDAYRFSRRDPIDIKGFGTLQTWFLEGRLSEGA